MIWEAARLWAALFVLGHLALLATVGWGLVIAAAGEILYRAIEGTDK